MTFIACRGRIIAAAVCWLAIPSIALAESVTKLTTMIDWALYTDADKPHQFCFLTSEPKTSEPADAAREAPRLYVSAWPKEGVTSEVSVRLGFPAKKGSAITASISPATFKLFASDERAYLPDDSTESKLVDAMKKGTKLAITATTATGATVTDTYSLSGLGQALQELKKTCF